MYEDIIRAYLNFSNITFIHKIVMLNVAKLVRLGWGELV